MPNGEPWGVIVLIAGIALFIWWHGKNNDKDWGSPV